MRPLNIVLGVAFGLAASTVVAVPVSFPGGNTGAIPDNDVVNGRVVTFAVSGLVGTLRGVELTTNLSHTFAGDLTATLISPGGTARLVIFGRPGAGRVSTFGDSSNFGGTYAFSDLGRPDLVPALTAIDTNGTLGSGTYRTTSRGASGRSNAGGCPTSLRGVFGGLTAAEVNGTWTLVVTDAVNGDVGTIDTSTLTLDMQGPSIFANGFEAAAALAPEAKLALGALAPAHCVNKVQADFTGDGLTDYAIARSNGGTVGWIIRENLGNGTAAATELTFNLGNATSDFIDSFDLDGDRIADPAVWTPGPNESGRFQVRLSSRNGAVREVVFGQTGDDPTQSGDYDGDGIDDLAVYRSPPFGSPDGPLQLRYLRSSNGSVGVIGTGTGVSGDQFAISGFDYSGDGLADVVVQEPDTTTPANARFRMLNASSGAQFSSFVLGLATDFLIPGSHVGSSWADVTVRRTVSGNRELRSRDSQTGVEAPVVVFGITGDASISGDYDGDGVSDHGIWRSSSTPGDSAFQVRPSGNTASVWSIPFGQAADYPIAGSRVR
ncbi:hypothetical protein SAMN04488509_102544 [Aquimonas voraii]|uniref:P/Homo B domain-containing protein n=2 Tax=Aquimonas voraii TaxID=265719 RepID=A0A1G6UXY8_9GAMM|nr:hypothetical protein SAMN04488509_102544 [Aquimonas voraii]